MAGKRLEDLTGERYGSWLLVERITIPRTKTKYLCRCECGIEKIVGQSSLRAGRSTKCISCEAKIKHKGKISKSRKYKIGDKTSTYEIIKVETGTNYLVSCLSCGTQNVVHTSNMARNKFGCKGCYVLMSSQVLVGPKLPDYIYDIWYNMRDRCFNTKNKSFKDYGGRGISLFLDWQKSGQGFKDFRDYLLTTLGQRPNEDFSIDRIDNMGNYEPLNLRWSNRSVQNNNKRNNVQILYNNNFLTLREVSLVTSIPYKYLSKLYYQYEVREVPEFIRRNNIRLGNIKTKVQYYGTIHSNY